MTTTPARDPWHSLGIRSRSDEWERPCIFACEQPCAEQCTPMTHNGRRRTLLQASQTDQRFSYCMYVPDTYREYETRTYPLLVLIHGTERDPEGYRNGFSQFAEEHQCIVLAPLFPCGIIEPALEMHNYKFLRFHDIRFDLFLLDLIDEVGTRYRLDAERFLLFGFSGGGQFVHRFAYLHGKRLMGVSIGAPGWVTLPDPDKPWWVGTGGMADVFGTPADLEALGSVPIQIVVGADDLDGWDVVLPEGSRYWMPGINDTGATRVERMHALRDGFAAIGIDARLDLVDGASHDETLMFAQVQDFFGPILNTRNEGTTDEG